MPSKRKKKESPFDTQAREVYLKLRGAGFGDLTPTADLLARMANDLIGTAQDEVRHLVICRCKTIVQNNTEDSEPMPSLFGENDWDLRGEYKFEDSTLGEVIVTRPDARREHCEAVVKQKRAKL